jgi:peptidylprolyl isomerase
MPTRRIATAALVSLGLILAACGDDTKTASQSGDTTVVSSDSVATGSTTVAGVSTKPTVTIPDGAAPTTLQSTDLTVGTGAEATAGHNVTVQYVGVAWSTKAQFDASWDRGQPFSFSLGSGQVIKGWDQGVAGMNVGGRRQLVLPPDLGYGNRGAGGAIKPGETLVFVVDLLSVS